MVERPRRRSEPYPGTEEDDMNQSYVLDISGHEGHAKELRQKKREIENNYGTRKSNHSTHKTFDMNNSDESMGMQDFNESNGSFDSSFRSNGGTRKRIKKRVRKSNNLDNSADYTDEGSVGPGRSTGGKRVVQMRDTNRVLRNSNHGPPGSMQRQESTRPGLGPRNDSCRPGPAGMRPNMARDPSGRVGPNGGQLMMRRDQQQQQQQRGRPAMPRQNSSPGGMTMERQNSSHMPRSRSLDPQGMRDHDDRSVGTTGTARMRSRSQSMDRSRSQGSVMGPPGREARRRMSQQRPSQATPMGSRRSMSRENSKVSALDGSKVSTIDGSKVIQQGNKTIVMVPMTKKEAEELRRNPTNLRKNHPYARHLALRKKFKVEETPPRSLVVIWSLVIAELVFDLGTTFIAFTSLLGTDNCCGQTMDLGPIPMTVTSPFFLLVIAELAFLSRAIILTLWPSIMTKGPDALDLEDPERKEERSGLMAAVCCCMKWNAKMLLKVLNFLVLLNPFFGCVIAWVLLYQSDKTESFIVLALEGGSIILHFISVYLEGGLGTCTGFLIHCIPLIPFIVSVTMVLVYLKYGGVCYVIEKRSFFFTGCQLCGNGWPPIDGMCLVNGTNVTVDVSNNLLDVSIDVTNIDVTNGDLHNLASELTARTEQGTYCQKDNPGGPPGDVCWFQY